MITKTSENHSKDAARNKKSNKSTKISSRQNHGIRQKTPTFFFRSCCILPAICTNHPSDRSLAKGGRKGRILQARYSKKGGNKGRGGKELTAQCP